MQDLFRMDNGDYKKNGKVFRRPSVRAVIEQDGKILLVYSKKYDYYKFPGGGINPNETNEEALVREVQEESGYIVIPETIEEFGRVMRRQNDKFCEDSIFEQENLYYFCEVRKEPTETNLDAYEAEEGFTPVWADPIEASWHNHCRRNPKEKAEISVREEKVLVLADRELRKRARKSREEKTIQSLGTLDFAGMLAFVKEILERAETENIGGKFDISYSRFEHTKRVLGWAKRLCEQSECKDMLHYEDIMIATIFHDVGRSGIGNRKLSHAKAGMPITEEYLLSHGYSRERTDYICSLVGAHSDKHRMNDADLDPNLLVLLEADLLDDMGALGVVMDCMIVENRNRDASFSDCLDHIMAYTQAQQRGNPMVSSAARKFWDEKTRIVDEFVEALKTDVEL